MVSLASRGAGMKLLQVFSWLSLSAILAASLISVANATPSLLPPEELTGFSGQLQFDGSGNLFGSGYQAFDGAFRALFFKRPAGGSWLEPIPVADDSQTIQPPLAVNERGDAVMALTRQDGGSNIIINAVYRPAGGSWGTVQPLSEPGEDAALMDVAIDPGGNAVAMWRRSDGVTGIRVQASYFSDGSWGPPQNVSNAGVQNPSVVVMDASGDAHAIWTAIEGGNYRAQTADRLESTGQWGNLQTLSAAGGNAGGVDITVNASGDAVAIWSRYNGSSFDVQTSYRPSGGVWSSPADIGQSNSYHPALHVDIDGAGNAAAIWTEDHGAGIAIKAGFRSHSSGVWGITPLDPSGVAQNPPIIAMNDRGDAIASWTRFDSEAPSNTPEMAYRTVQAGNWSSPQSLSPVGVNGLSLGVAIDGEGNGAIYWVSQVTNANYVSGYDAAGPRAQVNAPNNKWQKKKAFRVKWTASDRWSTVDSYKVRLRRAPAKTAGFGDFQTFKNDTNNTSATFTGVPGNTYCFSARATDAVGNTGAFSSQKCTALPLNNTQLKATGSWSEHTGSGYYLNTYSETKRAGDKLSAAVKGKRFALVATLCPKCGKVVVKLGTKTLKNLSLKAGSTKKAQVISVGSFDRLKSGKLTIKVTSTGRLVRIEGLGVGAV